jgi:hypothetical protein
MEVEGIFASGGDISLGGAESVEVELDDGNGT